jgi:hypothetical protein
VVLEQLGIWRALDTGEVIGESVLASAFRVNHHQVAWFARYHSLQEALSAAGLAITNKVR